MIDISLSLSPSLSEDSKAIAACTAAKSQCSQRSKGCPPHEQQQQQQYGEEVSSSFTTAIRHCFLKVKASLATNGTANVIP